MNTNQVQNRIKLLNEVILSLQRQIATAPEGNLRLSHSNGHVQYYFSFPGSYAEVRYLKKEELEQAKKLAQKKYDRMVLKSAERELMAWNSLLRTLPTNTFETVYDTLHRDIKTLVTPVVPTNEDYRSKWESVTYEPGSFEPDAPIYMTDRGERVRSKSEQLIANLLYRLDIPYRYEYPILINENGRQKVWRPDFMILDVAHRKEFFLEHLGMLDDLHYARRTAHKIRTYEENGLFEGSGMYYTMETDGVPIDMPYVEMKIRRILLMEGGGVPESFSTKAINLSDYYTSRKNYGQTRSSSNGYYG